MWRSLSFAFLTTAVLAGGMAVRVLGEGQQTPTFRAGIDIVDVDVSVLDRHRLPVRGLTAADFTVFEDGKPRPVVAFSAVDLPSREAPSAPWMAEVAPDVLTNAFPREGRLVTILMDRVPAEHLPAAQAFAVAAVEQLRPGDLAAVAFSTFGIPQNFTSDRSRLLAAVRQPMVGLPQGEDSGETDCYCGVCTLESVNRVAEAMQDVRQRRKILFVVGTRISILSTGRCGGPLSNLRTRALRALETGNITVHVFDPTGVETLAFSASERSAPTIRSTQAHLMRLGNLRVLPEHTGGRFVGDPFRPGDRVAELYRESDSYYVLGFQPLGADNRVRRLDIKVKVNRQDVTLQARRYYDPRPAKVADASRLPATLPPALRRAIAGLWPSTGVSIAMNVVPLAKPDLSAGIAAVTLDVTQEFEEHVTAGIARPPAGDDETVVNILLGAFDRNGKALAFDRQTLAVRPRRITDRRFTYQVPMSLELKAGRYEMRAAIEDATLGRTGSVYGTVDIPDFRRVDVSLSGIALEVRPSAPSSPAKAWANLVPLTPSARRSFARTDTVSAFARIYHGFTRAATPGYVTALVRDESDQVVFRQESRITGEHIGASRATDVNVDLPIARLAPGPYMLAIDTRHGSATASRQLRFEVHE